MWGLFVLSPDQKFCFHLIFSTLEDPTFVFKLVLSFERDHPGKGHSAAVWVHQWSFSCVTLWSPSSPSLWCLRAPPGGATDAGLLLDTSPYAAWTMRLPRADSYTSLEHWLQKLLFYFNETNKWKESVHISSFLPSDTFLSFETGRRLFIEIFWY